ncbi:hypothetical protein D9M71_849350 [compost metagenome]
MQAHLVNAIRSHAAAEYPRECCGLIVANGRRRRYVLFFVWRNTWIFVPCAARSSSRRFCCCLEKWGIRKRLLIRPFA